jgi:hypothetical protein
MFHQTMDTIQGQRIWRRLPVDPHKIPNPWFDPWQLTDVDLPFDPFFFLLISCP